jgi:hypothetical protein
VVPVVVVPVTRRVPSRGVLHRLGRILLGVLQFGSLALATALVCAHFLLGLSLHPVLSDSMQPAFSAGDYLVTVQQDALTLAPGQIPLLTFEDGTTRAHRILQTSPERGTVRLLTRGDANPTADAWTSVDAETPVPVVITTLPAVPTTVSAVVRALQANPLPTAIAIGIGGLGLTAWAIRRQYLRLRDCQCDECCDRRENDLRNHHLTQDDSQTQEIR